MPRRSLIALSLFALLFAACSSEETEAPGTETLSSPIVGGWLEPGMEYTVAILENGDPVCTGTLVDTRVVVTAGHCVWGNLGTLQVFFGINANNLNSGTTVDVDSYEPHPSFNPYALSDDIGVIVLDADAPVAAAPILPTGVFDASWIGTDLRFVGYGSAIWWGGGAGRRRAVDIAVDQVDSSTFTYYDNQHETCYGDSGGPAFAEYDGQWQLIGVTSYGDYYCNTYGVNTRVDAFDSWIEGFLDDTPPDPNEATELTPGTVESGSLGADELADFTFATQSGYRYDVIVAPSSGDADLYTHDSEDIDLAVYTCASTEVGTDAELCTVTGAGNGDYYAMVHGATATSYDILVAESPATCHAVNNGHGAYCRNACPCGVGEGDCDNDNQCADGLHCAHNVGADYGFYWKVDVCEY
jgi:secreted trypsin-like serine protease